MSSRMKISPVEVGKAFAHATDSEQAEMLNSMGAELKVCCKDKELSGSQCCYMSDGLNKHGKDFVKSLATFIESRERNEKEADESKN